MASIIATAAMMELLSSPYFVLTLEENGAANVYVRAVRTATPFPTTAAIREQYSQVIGRLDRLGRKNRCMLVDLRRAPGRSDPAFESIMKELRPKLFAGFSRVGVLTSTSLGLLQVRRLAREDGVDILTSTSEEELRAFFK